MFEEEIIRFVVDSVFEQFPHFRCSFSRLEPSGKVNVIYSRQPANALSLAGKVLDLSSTPEILGSLLSGQKVVLPDLGVSGSFEAISYDITPTSKAAALMAIPIGEEHGKVNLITLSSSNPEDWSSSAVSLLNELGELVSLMAREARTRVQLQNNETLFKQFVENVEMVIWVSDIYKNEIVYVSPAYENIWGRTMQSLYDEPRSFLAGIHPEDRERVTAAVMRQADEIFEQKYRVIQPSGQMRWVKDRAFRVRDENGRVHRIVGIAEDITQLQLAQETLQATQAKVISNTKFAALGEMASGIAHEINNPLAVIHGLSVQLQEQYRNQGNVPKSLLESLASMEKMSNRIAAIVKGLRTFSRQTAGDPMTPADIIAIAQETFAMCEPKLRAADIETRIQLPSEQIWVQCRSSEISQVILNLLSNAYDAVAHVPIRKITVGVEATVLWQEST